jgi:hypothetical protein
MSKIKYKEFTKEEENIYDNAITEIRDNIKKGMKFEDACSSVNVEDDDLKLIILEDFLKITIADMHYTHRKTIDEIAEELDIPVQSVALTHKRMLDDIMNTQKGNLELDDPETLGFPKPKGNA